MLNKIIQNPYLNLLIGFILLFTSGYETWHTFSEFSIGSHHGILLFSISHILKTISDFKEGLKDINESIESP